MYKWILTLPLIIIRMVGMMVDLVRKWEEPFTRALANLENNSGLEIPNAHKSLEHGDVGKNLVQMRHPGSLKAYVRELAWHNAKG